MDLISKERIEARLADLHLTQFDAAERAGLGRTYVYDFLIGKKDTMRKAQLSALASVLDCDPEYLLGRQDTFRRADIAGAPAAVEGQMPFGGFCEAGAWRTPGASDWPRAVPISADPRYPAGDQVAFIVKGTHAEPFHIFPESILVAVENITAREGDVVVAERRKPDGDFELTVRKYENGNLVAKGDSFDASSAKIRGLVIRSVKIFS